LVIVEYHPSVSNDPFYLPWSAQRANFYSVPGYPTVKFDGIVSHVGTYGSPTLCANQYRLSINQRLAIPANITVEGSFSYSTETISLSAVFTVESAVTLNTPMAVLAVLEDGLHSGAYDYNHVVRAGEGRFVNLVNVGDQEVVTADFPISANWNMDNIRCVAWLQRAGGTTFPIYQAAELPLVVDFAFDYEDDLVTVPDGNEVVLFNSTLTNTTEEAESLTLSLSDTFGWPTDFMVAGETDFHTTPSVVELDPLESVQVTLRVTTDGTVRIGEGGLQIVSPARVVVKRARIFNGGPAVLFVDDDGSYPHQEEDVLLAALDVVNTLYDHWDVRKDHGGRVPTVAEMSEYDAVIWHPGRQNTMILDDKVQVLHDYVAAGGGLLFSYQQFLAYADTSSNPVTAAFVADDLGIGSYVLDAGADSLIGSAGDPIGDGVRMAFSYESSVHNKADALTANAAGTITLRSQTGDGIVIRADHQDSRVVYFACYLNAVSNAGADPNNLTSLLDRSLQWVIARNSASVEDGDVLAGRPGISWIAPNPYRTGLPGAHAAIHLRVPEAAAGRPARLDVFDLNGRLVRNLIDEALPAGTAVAGWDGCGVTGDPAGSGMYYLRFVTATGADGARMLVIR